MKCTKKMVEYVLENDELTRSDDGLLLIKLITIYGNIPLMDMPTFCANMKRFRAYFQTKGFYLATPQILEKRLRHSKYWRDEFKMDKKDIQDISILKSI